SKSSKQTWTGFGPSMFAYGLRKGECRHRPRLVRSNVSAQPWDQPAHPPYHPTSWRPEQRTGSIDPQGRSLKKWGNFSDLRPKSQRPLAEGKTSGEDASAGHYRPSTVPWTTCKPLRQLLAWAILSWQGRPLCSRTSAPWIVQLIRTRSF